MRLHRRLGDEQLRRDAGIAHSLRHQAKDACTAPFQRRHGLVTLTATTAAGERGYRVRDVGLGTALTVTQAVTPGLVTRFTA
ncbi:hypothetical protein [Kibdelosporangium phytohabitans]|uniref:Uncharacterized protein n=1 Tax=Kibdelosporangium phytohabitans TaxID=860235 RepID=A0A0N9HNH7_9PSEU|nr:hypothetical protein AOZ06_17650 [Kibdelosporangium phytohabitans]MBE1470437.1 putative membrane protein YdbT with pleckstrin-like domain [Kibdelosporangium phytohabitans]